MVELVRVLGGEGMVEGEGMLPVVTVDGMKAGTEALKGREKGGAVGERRVDGVVIVLGLL